MVENKSWVWYIKVGQTLDEKNAQVGGKDLMQRNDELFASR